jgi:hypothetical protein
VLTFEHISGNGILLAHYAIRALLCQAADEAGYDLDRLSDVAAVRVVRR